MASLLSDVQEQIERSIYEALRSVLVSEGYLPDITTFPNTEAGTNSYLAAQEAIIAVKGFCIELFGAGSIQKKGLKKVPRIVINTRRYLPGELGTPPEGIFQLQDDNTYTRLGYAPTTSELQFDIHVISKTIRQDRVMHGVVGLALTTRKYIQIYNSVDTKEKFFIEQIGFRDSADTDEQIVEKVYTYRAKDIYQSKPIPTQTGIAPITEITLNSNTGNQPAEGAPDVPENSMGDMVIEEP